MFNYAQQNVFSQSKEITFAQKVETTLPRNASSPRKTIKLHRSMEAQIQ